MKRLKQIFLSALPLFVIILITSCSPGTMGEEITGVDGNPENMKDWKWYEYQEDGYTLFSRSGSDIYSITTHTNVQLPFFDSDSSAGKELYRPKSSDVDMYPSDGWVLVKANFGSLTDAPHMPYFILYNRARAILRLFYYFPADMTAGYSYSIVKLEQDSGKSSMFSFFDSAHCFTDDFNENKTLVTVSNMSPNSWCYADFVISYDPNVMSEEQKNSYFYFSIYGVDKSDVSLAGELTLNQSKHANHLMTSGTKNATQIIDASSEMVSYYSSQQNFLDYCGSSIGSWYSDILNDVGDGVVVGGSIGGPEGALVGGLAGVVKSMITGGKGSGTIPMNFTGEIVMGGEIIKTSLLCGIGLNVPGAIIDTDFPEKLSYYNKPLGIISIKSKPVVDITVDVLKRNIDGSTFYKYKVKRIKMKDNVFPEISFNNIDGYLVDTVEVGFVFSNSSVDMYLGDTAYGIHFIHFSNGEGIQFSEWWTYFYQNSFRYHEENDVEFKKLEDFKISDFNYSDTVVVGTLSDGTDSVFGYESGVIKREWNGGSDSAVEINNKVKKISKLIAPEIAIKVTLYSVDDVEKQNPIVHLKRVRANYNLYKYSYEVVDSNTVCYPVTGCTTTNAYDWVTTGLGFYTN